jgi:membrane-associated phospholipid phosphatase
MKEKLKKYKHGLWALYFPVYLLGFFWVESVVTSDSSYWVSYMKLDDIIPFCEWFAPVYYLWYPFLAAVGIYLLINDAPAFKRYMWGIIISFTASIIFFVIFPNGQDLRINISEYAHDNFCTRMVAAIYSVDTNTNVLPSIHVVGSAIGAFAVFDCKKLQKNYPVKIITVIVAGLMSIATVFLKQHSILDIYTGLAVSAVMYVIIYVIIKGKMNKN